MRDRILKLLRDKYKTATDSEKDEIRICAKVIKELDLNPPEERDKRSISDIQDKLKARANGVVINDEKTYQTAMEIFGSAH